MIRDQKKMENPFLRKDAEEIQVNDSSPYRDAKTLRTVMEFIRKDEGFRVGEAEVSDTGNPYMAPAEYEHVTGIKMVRIGASEECSEPQPAFKIWGTHQKLMKKFQFELDGIYLRPKNPMLDEPKQLTNFDFHITGLLRRHHRDGTVKNFVEYVVSDHEEDPQIIEYANYGIGLVDAILSQFPDCCLIGANAVVKAQLKEIAAAKFSEANRMLLVKEIFTYHGWETISGKMVYLSSARKDCETACFVPDIEPEREVEVWREGMQILEIGKKKFLPDGSVDFMESYRVSLPFFLYLHMGYMAKLFQDAGLNLQFLLVIIGKSGSLKTSTCKAFAEPFHPGGILRLESTPRALELYRESCIDQTMIADDIFCQKGAIMSKFEDILRAFGDEIGRAKSSGANFNDLVRTQVRGGCIVTAENSLDSQQSSALRYVTLNFEPDSIDPDRLRCFQENQRVSSRKKVPSIVQEYFAGWIHYAERNQEKILSFLDTFDSPVPAFRFKRHVQIYRAFDAISILILRWGVGVGAIEEDAASTTYSSWMEIIRKLLHRNEELAITAEPWKQFLIALHAAIATGAALLASGKEEFEAGTGKFLGFVRQDGSEREYVLSPAPSYVLVKRRMQEAGKTFVSDATNIYRDLFEHGIAKGYANQANGKSTRNRYLKRVKLHGHLVEMLVISSNSMEKTVEEIREGKV